MLFPTGSTLRQQAQCSFRRLSNRAPLRGSAPSRAHVAPRTSGSASAAPGQAWPRCLSGARRVLLSIARASAGVERLVRTRRMSRPTAALCGPCCGTPSGPRDLSDRLAFDEMLAPNPADRLHCQHFPHRSLRIKASSASGPMGGGQFWTPIPPVRGSKLHAE